MNKKMLLFFMSGMLALPTFSQTETGEPESETHTSEEDDIDNYSGEEEGIQYVEGTFSATRVINGHSTETLEKNMMEFRIEHRFGDVAGAAGGVQTMFGFDNVADIRLAFEYGILDDLLVGIGRSKGTGVPYRSLIDGFAKYKILKQVKGGMPISMSAQVGTSFSYMKKTDDVSEISSFPDWQHRFAYYGQLSIAKKLGKRVGLLLSPTVVHRNFVAYNDVNTLFSLGSAARFGITPTMAFIVEYYHSFSNAEGRALNQNSLGVAFEFETFGHNFTINLTNSRGFGETQFIPYTYSNWGKGQFRLGFTIGRKYAFGH